MSTADGDLQSVIAAYMSRQRTRRVTLDELCQAIPSANRNTLSVALSKIVAGEARPYPIVRSGRGVYTWVHDPADRPAHLAVLAEIIGYMTGLDHDNAADLAGQVLRMAAVRAERIR